MSDDEVPTARVFRAKKPINRKTKKHITFDPIARKEFLTGFRKRKLERKRKAEEALQKELKDERKRLKQEAREAFAKLIGAHRAAPTLEDLGSNEYELKNHTVSVVDLSASDLAEKNNWIGPNMVQYEEEQENDENEEKEQEEQIPGMELNSVKEVKVALRKKATEEVKNSRAFQRKNRMERQKNKKKSRRQQRLKEKQHGKRNKRVRKSRKKN